jgi:tRNA pseudouridine55 synthase
MFILINKSVGPTSHTIVNKLRRITGIKKIGHAGTLDPFADGLLLLAIGRDSTRHISDFVGLDKEYLATLKFGITTDSYDKDGKVISRIKPGFSKKELKKVLQKFKGKQDQIPPMFSAKKINGKKLYELARKGQEIERQPNQIIVHKIKIKKFNRFNHTAQILFSVSSGTYIRSLGHDIGQALKCGAHLIKLKRTKIGNYKLKNSVKIKKLNKKNWQKFTFEK